MSGVVFDTQAYARRTPKLNEGFISTVEKTQELPSGRPPNLVVSRNIHLKSSSDFNIDGTLISKGGSVKIEAAGVLRIYPGSLVAASGPVVLKAKVVEVYDRLGGFPKHLRRTSVQSGSSVRIIASRVHVVGAQILAKGELKFAKNLIGYELQNIEDIPNSKELIESMDSAMGLDEQL